MKGQKNSFWQNKKLQYLSIALGVVLLILLITELTNVTHFFHSAKATSSVIPSSKKSSTNYNSASSNTYDSGQSASSNDKSSSVGAGNNGQDKTASGDPMTPFGAFVSNHRPTLSNPDSLQEQSTCNTTPGANCAITFTNSSGVVKSLSSTRADANGVVIWSWNVKDAGFTSGSWKITATATLNGQKKSSNDAQNLEVQP